jgi:Kef-type K+ transport system membrane component KefB
MERPRSLQIATGLVVVQALALGIWALGELIRSLAGHPSDRGTAILLGVVVLLYAIGVVLDARGLWRARRWSQSPAYMVSFFAVVVGVGQLHTLPVLMVPLIVIGVATFVALSMPASRQALGGI